jgi:hypothetical protein
VPYQVDGDSIKGIATEYKETKDTDGRTPLSYCWKGSHILDISYIFYYNNFDREGPRGADVYILLNVAMF